MSKVALSSRINSKRSTNGAKPFLKWAGGKSQLLSKFEQYYPEELKSRKIQRYVEPFLGGGAVFFNIIDKYTINEAFLSDINEELILVYLVIQKNHFDLLNYLEEYEKKYSNVGETVREKFFYSTRDEFNNNLPMINFKRYSKNWINRAAQTIFLNKTCYNGLFRVNRKGHFNAPFGRYKKPKILDEENILAVSKKLQFANLLTRSFEESKRFINNNTFVYFDPPYRPISPTSSFTSYSKYEFAEKDQINLANFFIKIDKEKNAKLMLSNSDPTNVNPNDKFFEKHYNNYNIYRVYANRMINCNAEKRGQIKELLITNYEVKNEV